MTQNEIIKNLWLSDDNYNSDDYDDIMRVIHCTPSNDYFDIAQVSKVWELECIKKVPKDVYGIFGSHYGKLYFFSGIRHMKFRNCRTMFYNKEIM